MEIFSFFGKGTNNLAMLLHMFPDTNSGEVDSNIYLQNLQY